MPVSSCTPNGAPDRLPAWRAHWAGEFRRGMSPCAPIAAVSPSMCPPKTKIRGPGPSAARTVAPSEASATKKVRAPSAASARATRAAPSP